MIFLGLFACSMKQSIERNINWNKIDICAWPTWITNSSNNVIENFRRNGFKNGKLNKIAKNKWWENINHQSTTYGNIHSMH